MDKAVKKIEHCEDECKSNYFNTSIVEKTKKDVLGMNDYLLKDRFNADQFELNIDRNLKNARIAWTSDSV